MNFKVVKTSYGLMIFLVCLFLFGVLLLLKGKCAHPINTTTTDQIIYVKLSDASPRHVEIHWKPIGYLFVTADKRPEQLFAYGNGYKIADDAWMHDGIKYEFHLYEDKERKKPIATVFFVKSGDTINQHTVDIRQGESGTK